MPRWFGPADTIYTAHRTDNELDIKAGFGSTGSDYFRWFRRFGWSIWSHSTFWCNFGERIPSLFFLGLGTDTFIGCGVAAGIAAAFGAPIAGVIFAHEAVLRHFSLRAIVPISIASITSVWFSDYFFEVTSIFDLGAAQFQLVTLAPIALLCGPIFGIAAIVLMSLTRFLSRQATASALSPMKLSLLAALIVGIIGGFMPEVLGLGTEIVQKTLRLDYSVHFLAFLFALKIIATSICLGLGLFGGIFSPALFVGAAIGALIGQILAPLVGLVTAVALAVSGMAAVASAVIGAQCRVLIVLELTGSYQLALCVMLSVMSCILITSLVFGHSYFDRQLLDRGIDVTKGRGQSR